MSSKLSALPQVTDLLGSAIVYAVDGRVVDPTDRSRGILLENLFRTAPAGTLAAPAISFLDDQASGLYLAAVGDLRMVSSGSITLGALDSLGVNITSKAAIGENVTAQPNLVLVIGDTPLASGTNLFGVYGATTVPTGATGTFAQYYSNPRTAAALAINTVCHYRAAATSLGAGSTAAVIEGFTVTNALTQGALNYGFRGLLAVSGETCWNLYMDGTAPNLFRGAVVIPAANTLGIQLYNTIDQVSNYERLELKFSSNVARITSTAGGTGITRSIAMGVGSGRQVSVNIGSSSTIIDLEIGTYAIANGKGISTLGTLTQTSGTNYFWSFTPTYNQTSGTAANTDIFLNRTETAIGSGTQLLIDLQVGAVSKFKVDRTGAATFAAGVTLSGSGGATIDNASATNGAISSTGGGMFDITAPIQLSGAVRDSAASLGISGYALVSDGSGILTYKFISRSTPLHFICYSGGNYGAITSTEGFLGGNNRTEKRFDSTGYTQARITLHIGSTASNATTTIYAKYYTANSTTYSDFLPVGAGATQLSVTLSTAQNTQFTSGWVNLTVGAIGDVYWIIGVVDTANASISPSISSLSLEFR